ncbi:hypothetical protein CALCODRAFT_478933 [Calocera cornea HHB12733]|uniref:Uncharacterized protein n=1 Tax=Calocera cornea HHB12733 TaxID=1353952 RepID=A0A165K3K7_9BASI|nr:hypothetical protein CALCODRAFT_478933 [Calocera cornea HHB12733]
MTNTDSLQSLFSKSDAASIKEALQRIVTRHALQKPYLEDMWTRLLAPPSTEDKSYWSGPYKSTRKTGGVAAFDQVKDLVVSSITSFRLPICDAMSAIDVLLANAYPPTNDAQARMIGTLAYKWHRALFPDFGYGRVSFVPRLCSTHIDFVPAGITVPPTTSTIPPQPGSSTTAAAAESTTAGVDPAVTAAAGHTTQAIVPHRTARTDNKAVPSRIARTKQLHRQHREACLESGLGKEHFEDYKRCVAVACTNNFCIDQPVPQGGSQICMCAELLFFVWLLQFSKTPAKAKLLSKVDIILNSVDNFGLDKFIEILPEKMLPDDEFESLFLTSTFAEQKERPETLIPLCYRCLLLLSFVNDSLKVHGVTVPFKQWAKDQKTGGPVAQEPSIASRSWGWSYSRHADPPWLLG